MIFDKVYNPTLRKLCDSITSVVAFRVFYHPVYMDMANVKYAFVQNAQCNVKYQSVLFLPTNGGIPGWFGLRI